MKRLVFLFCLILLQTNCGAEIKNRCPKPGDVYKNKQLIHWVTGKMDCSQCKFSKENQKKRWLEKNILNWENLSCFNKLQTLRKQSDGRVFITHYETLANKKNFVLIRRVEWTAIDNTSHLTSPVKLTSYQYKSDHMKEDLSFKYDEKNNLFYTRKLESSGEYEIYPGKFQIGKRSLEEILSEKIKKAVGQYKSSQEIDTSLQNEIKSLQKSLLKVKKYFDNKQDDDWFTIENNPETFKKDNKQKDSYQDANGKELGSIKPSLDHKFSEALKSQGETVPYRKISFKVNNIKLNFSITKSFKELLKDIKNK